MLKLSFLWMRRTDDLWYPWPHEPGGPEHSMSLMRCYNTGLIFNPGHMSKLWLKHRCFCYTLSSSYLKAGTDFTFGLFQYRYTTCIFILKHSMCRNIFFFFFLQGAMQAQENKGAADYANGGAGHMNGTESSRMREVAFEKNPSEPMVTQLTHTHTQACSAILFRT